MQQIKHPKHDDALVLLLNRAIFSGHDEAVMDSLTVANSRDCFNCKSRYDKKDYPSYNAILHNGNNWGFEGIEGVVTKSTKT